MCFNNDSTNLSLICYFTIKLANGTNEYFLTTYYIWQEPHKNKDKDENKNKDKHEEEDHDPNNKDKDENKNEVVPLPKQNCQKYQVSFSSHIVIRAKNA
jgi:hypothetical protein